MRDSFIVFQPVSCIPNRVCTCVLLPGFDSARFPNRNLHPFSVGVPSQYVQWKPLALSGTVEPSIKHSKTP